MNIKDSIVNIMVTDMDRSINFYQKIGLTLKQRWDNYYAIVDSPSVKIGLHPSEPRDSSNQISIGFIIDDIEAAKALLEKNDIAYSLEKDENSGTYLNFSDPDGAKLYYHLPSW